MTHATAQTHEAGARQQQLPEAAQQPVAHDVVDERFVAVLERFDGVTHRGQRLLPSEREHVSRSLLSGIGLFFMALLAPTCPGGRAGSVRCRVVE